MFILRFIGRILSIGFILFIALVVSGKHARADGAWPITLVTGSCGVSAGVEFCRAPRHSRALTP